MVGPIAISILQAFIHVILGSELFARIEAAVDRWAEKDLSHIQERKERNHTRREGVILELEALGIHAAEWAIRAAIELAVGRMHDFEVNYHESKRKAG
jgi:hypothetical protein